MNPVKQFHHLKHAFNRSEKKLAKSSNRNHHSLSVIKRPYLYMAEHLTAILCGIALIFASFLGPFAAAVLPGHSDQETIDQDVLYSNTLEDLDQLTDNTSEIEGIYPTLNEDSLEEQNTVDLEAGDNRSNILSSLYARYAVIMDADNGRVLLGKNETTAAPNASTTKIMTCIIALEYGNFDLPCTTSKYAASMPDVQLNADTGEQFALNDLLYSLMLKSHNDTAVIIAENVAYHYIYQVATGSLSDDASILTEKDLSFVDTAKEYDSTFLSALTTDQSKLLVSVFAGLMNHKATSLGCTGTHFITPNGLDAEDETGVHSTTPVDLATIMSYCIQNPEFLKITESADHTFTSTKINSKGESVTGGSYSVTNANAFLHMYDNIISGKTGFTGDAGYCYVCAYKCETRSFIVVLLACGWPNNKTYKWHDARLLLNWAREKYFEKEIVSTDLQLKDVTIKNGLESQVSVAVEEPFHMLLSDFDVVNVVMNIPTPVSAPITTGQQLGTVNVYVNDTLVKEIPAIAQSDVQKTGFFYYLKKALNLLTFVDN